MLLFLTSGLNTQSDHVSHMRKIYHTTVLKYYSIVLIYKLVGSKIKQCFTTFYLFYLEQCTKSAQDPFPIRISIVIITQISLNVVIIIESHNEKLLFFFSVEQTFLFKTSYTTL